MSHTDRTSFLPDCWLFIIYVGQCFTSDGLVEQCSSEQCGFGLQRDFNDEQATTQFCANNDDKPAAGLYFTMKFNLKHGNIFRRYQLRCAYDKCNNFDIMTQVMEIFHQEYELVTVLKVFGFEITEEGTYEQTTRTSIESSSSRRLTSSVQSSTTTSLVISKMTGSSARSTATTSSTTNANIIKLAQLLKQMVDYAVKVPAQ